MGRGNKLQGIATIVEFQLSDSLSPWERARARVKQSNPPEALCSARKEIRSVVFAHENRENYIPFAIISANIISVIRSLSPWERARERAKQSNPPEALRSVQRKVVAWALPAKTGKTSDRSPSFPQTSPAGKAHATVLYKTHTTFRRPST